ncbi:hypothetical protein; 83642-85072 [Arabidopsis thaliana]|uniref:Putative F-box protein At1g33530 n=1 Tax=Arabidopsis thaliana TaxID=3702 RepID=FB34_ARATH|nr:F-box family protein [Arabidopsis thaliana]Q9C800.1 RecName: Full=Putative F-box protein At1g33530 [Arabidopsis thaliana]AAG51205.1 hypothetical protein; 83642-85072 [Arabidopsis thaliana]AEE31603.1 F-box family protein [Arabidopsis thaliana]|eukprot:NP_174618.1 F-box family protein [Arabidopsis thaliana]
MTFSIEKLVDLKRKKWQSKLQNTKKQVLGRCLTNFSRLLSFRKKQETNGKSPRCSKATLAVVVHPTASTTHDDFLRKKQERSGKSPSCSETTLAVELPDVLVEEILQRLPVKYLVRLKSISKGWKSLIESDHLAEKHLRLLEKKYGLKEIKITVERSTSKSICIKFFSRRSGMNAINSDSDDLLRVPGSCNGLVCVYELDSVYIYLLNPMTGVTRTLTPPRGTKLSVGFGIDVVTGTYKVMVLYGFDRVGTVVFDLDTNKWRQRYKTAGPMPLSCIPTPERNPVFVNGSLFWLLASDFSEILVMDLHTEKFRTLSQPNDMDDVDVSSGYIYMWSLEDRLCVSNVRQGLHSYVWVLVQDELSEKWERTRFNLLGHVFPPLSLNSAWFSQTLVSPYQLSSSTCIGSRQRQNSTSALFSRNGDTGAMDAPIELHISVSTPMMPL